MRLDWWQIAEALIETLSKVILDAFASCGRMTAAVFRGSSANPLDPGIDEVVLRNA